MSTFPGQGRVMAAGYAMVRAFTSATLSNERQLMRTADWFGKAQICPVNVKAAAQARGELKRVVITVTSGSVTMYLRPSPGDQTSTANTSYGVEWTFQNGSGIHDFYLDTGGGAATFEVWVEFDVPRAEDV